MAKPRRGRRPSARAHRQSEFRQSREAGRDGAIGGLPAGDRRGIARRWIFRSFPATSRSTTRPWEREFRRRRRSAASGCWRMSARRPRSRFAGRAKRSCLIGGSPGWLGRSAWLATCLGREEGAPPPVDLAAERRNGEFVLVLIAAGRVSAVHDVSDGGLAVALAEMAIASGIGATIDAAAVEGEPHGFFFGEDQGRYVVTSADFGLRESDGGRRPRRRADGSHRRDRRPRIDLAGRSADSGWKRFERRSSRGFPPSWRDRGVESAC